MIQVFLGTALLGPALPLGAQEPTPSRIAKAEALLQESGDTFAVQVGGHVDAESSFSWLPLRQGGIYSVETMRSLTLRNVGAATVNRPRVAINGRGRWWTPREAVTEILGEAQSDQEKAYRIWRFLSLYRYNWRSELPRAEMADPFNQLKVYGYSLCGRAGQVALEFFAAAGLHGEMDGPRPFLRLMNGHVQGETVVDGRIQFFDVDERRFVLDRENELPVSGDELSRDHDLNSRELFNGPSHAPRSSHDRWDLNRTKSARWGADDLQQFFAPPAENPGPDFFLRPGEEITFYWSPPDRWYGAKPPLMGRGRILYRPLRGKAPLEATADFLSGFAHREGGLVATKDSAIAIFHLDSPWPLVGGSLEAETELLGSRAALRWEVSFDRKNWQVLSREEVLAGSEGRTAETRVSLDSLFPHSGKKGPIRRDTWVRLFLSEGRASRLKHLELVHDFMSSPISQPSLRVGENVVEYLDAGASGAEVREVEIAVEWAEWDDPIPPPPPEAPATPGAAEEVAATFVPFAWPRTEGAAAWQLVVSKRRDFAWPYRPNYDVIVEDPSYQVPLRGMFSPNQTYYWRVRARSEDGIWGPWSSTWTFTWKGPRVVRNLRWKASGSKIDIHWDANPEGQRPARFRVYGANERGFSIEKNPKAFFVLGDTEETSMTVVDGDSMKEGMNLSFYRVVPIDEDGVEGPLSEFVELPRPWVYRRPPTKAKVGEEYEGQLETLLSNGDLQVRPRQIDGRRRADYWEKERVTYEMLRGPRWLRLKEAKGKLSGIPQAGDEGAARIEILVRITQPYEVPPETHKAERFRTHQPNEEIWAFILEVEAADPETSPAP